MIKDPKALICDIQNEFEDYVRTYGGNDVSLSVLYFEDILKDFYDNAALYFLERYEKEKNLSLEYGETLNWYLATFSLPYKYLYTDKLQLKHSLKKSYLDNLVFKTRKKLCVFSTRSLRTGTKYKTEQLCGMSSTWFQKEALKHDDIKSIILTTNGSFGIPECYMPNRAHAFNLVIIGDKKYIVDCTFSQFTKLFFMSQHVIKLPFCIAPEPAYFLLKTENGEKLLNRLLTYGWFEATDENVKAYLDSFVLSTRNAYYYLNGGNINDTGIDSKYYSQLISEFEKSDGSSLEAIKKYSDADNLPLIYGKNEETGPKRNCYLTKKELLKIDKMIKN